MEIGRILLWIFGLAIGYLVISFLFFPVHFRDIQNSFSQAGARLNVDSREAIDMNHNCDFSSAEFFGFSKKDVIKADCTNACGKKDLTYVSYGCPGDKFTCYCN